jgi:hypothetical protein
MNIRITGDYDVKGVSHYINDMDDDDDDNEDAMVIVIAFLVCVICAKVPEYRCENCDKVYKQEARYNAHIIECVGGDTMPRVDYVSATDFSELLRQNREMMELMRKQQETIQLLVSQLSPGLMVASK